jgi:hypothetical protein
MNARQTAIDPDVILEQEIESDARAHSERIAREQTPAAVAAYQQAIAAGCNPYAAFAAAQRAAPGLSSTQIDTAIAASAPAPAGIPSKEHTTMDPQTAAQLVRAATNYARATAALDAAASAANDLLHDSVLRFDPAYAPLLEAARALRSAVAAAEEHIADAVHELPRQAF